MNTQEYLERTKTALGLPSDYALAAHFGLTRSYISSMKNGRKQLSDELAHKIAEILKIHPGLVLIDMQREKAKTPEDKNIWRDVAKGFLLLLLPANRMAA